MAVVNLIGFNTGIGATDPGCALGPYLLHKHHLDKLLTARGVKTRWLSHHSVKTSSSKQLFSMLGKSLFANLARDVQFSLRHGENFITIGGDHSSAIGTWSGALNYFQGNFGLIWIDAHMDSHSRQTSPSGALHGMPLACLLGHDDIPMISSTHHKLDPVRTCLIGVRSFEPEEQKLLSELGVTIFSMKAIQKQGLAAVLTQAVEIATDMQAPFGISLDLDAIDPYDAPGVGTPVIGGVNAIELLSALKKLPSTPIGLEIAEFNPAHDRNSLTQNLIVDIIQATWQQYA